MLKITIIDDDLAIEIFMDSLRYNGHNTCIIPSASEAIDNIDKILDSDIIILDIIMPWPSSIERKETRSGQTAGMEIYREIRLRNVNIPILVYSAIQDYNLIDIFRSNHRTRFISKWSSPSMNQLKTEIYNLLGVDQPLPSKPVPFIVHGQNDKIKLSLKNYLQNVLKLPEPIILHEQPNLGLTIIEKFEEYAERSCLVFVLLTPDDKGSEVDDTKESKRRARQNVIFEMGYFIGLLGRKSGLVLLLHEGPIELPSDLSGIIYIDTKNGIESAGEDIRKEIQHVIQ